MLAFSDFCSVNQIKTFTNFNIIKIFTENYYEQNKIFVIYKIDQVIFFPNIRDTISQIKFMNIKIL